MKRKVLSALLAVAMTATLLVGCGNSDAGSTNQSTSTGSSKTDYKGTLSVMHFSTSEESQGNGGSDGFRTMISNWKSAHPDVTLEENVLANTDYKTQISTLAAANDLPDRKSTRLNSSH